jgi:hypothetical protein
MTGALFEFIAADLPSDDDLKLVLAECQPPETNA